MPTALLTGATGFIGSLIASSLIANGYEVHALTNGAGQERLGQNASKIKWHSASPADWKNIAAICDVFVNAAVVYDRKEIDGNLINLINHDLPLNIMNEICQSGRTVQCVLLDSFFSKFPSDATNQQRYTKSKKMLFDSVRSSFLSDTVSAVFLRLEHLYGVNDNPAKVFPSVIQLLLNNVPRIALTAGVQRRDLIYVDDAVAAVMTVIKKAPAGIHLCECGSGVATEIKYVFEKMKQLSASTTILGFGDIPGIDRISTSVADIKLLNLWGWDAKVSLEQGLSEVILAMKTIQR